MLLTTATIAPMKTANPPSDAKADRMIGNFITSLSRNERAEDDTLMMVNTMNYWLNVANNAPPINMNKMNKHFNLLRLPRNYKWRLMRQYLKLE